MRQRRATTATAKNGTRSSLSLATPLPAKMFDITSTASSTFYYNPPRPCPHSPAWYYPKTIENAGPFHASWGPIPSSATFTVDLSFQPSIPIAQFLEKFRRYILPLHNRSSYEKRRPEARYQEARLIELDLIRPIGYLLEGVLKKLGARHRDKGHFTSALPDYFYSWDRGFEWSGQYYEICARLGAEGQRNWERQGGGRDDFVTIQVLMTMMLAGRNKLGEFSIAKLGLAGQCQCS